MKIMGCRLENLIKVVDGYQKTGIPLIAYDGTNLMPSCTADDIGIYVLIPKLAKIFNLNLQSAIDLFFYSLLLSAFISGIIGFLYLYSSWLHRLVAATALIFLSCISLYVGDVYIAYCASAMAFIPWVLYFTDKKTSDKNFLLFAFLLGISLSFFHFIRAYSAIAIFLFFVFLLMTQKDISWRNKGIIFTYTILGMAIPALYFSWIYNQYVNYSNLYLSHYPLAIKNHLLWHQIYIGLGFLSFLNPEAIRYDDNCGVNKVLSMAPQAIPFSALYENILKHEVFHIIRTNLKFVLYTVFAKIGILFFFLLTFANVGLPAAFFYPKPWRIEIAFFIGLAFNALFCLLALPVTTYALGFIAFATYYGVVSINYALEQTIDTVDKTKSCLKNTFLKLIHTMKL